MMGYNFRFGCFYRVRANSTRILQISWKVKKGLLDDVG